MSYDIGQNDEILGRIHRFKDDAVFSQKKEEINQLLTRNKSDIH